MQVVAQNGALDDGLIFQDAFKLKERQDLEDKSLTEAEKKVAKKMGR